MSGLESSLILVAHRRAPVQRLIRTNLSAEGYDVVVSATSPATLAALQSGPIAAVVLDADLVRGDTPVQAVLRSRLLTRRIPLLLISWEPGDRLLARALGDVPFLSRPDDVDQICAVIHRLLERGVPA